MSEDSFRDMTHGEAVGLERAGRDLVYHLSRMLKLAAVHDAGNEALIKPSRLLAESIDFLSRLNPQWHVRAAHDHLFINEHRLRLDLEIYPHYLTVVEEMKKKGIGLMTFERPLTDVEALRFVYALHLHSPKAGFDDLLQALSSQNLSAVHLEEAHEATGYGGTEGGLGLAGSRVREMARETFFGAIYMTGGLLKSVEQRQTVNLRRARRVVQAFLDLLDMDEYYLLGLSSIKNYDDYTFNHSVNVTVLSLAMGRKLGLSRPQLSDLGLAAIFHDLGKVTLPREIVNKDSRLDEGEWEEIHRHPVEGVKKLLQLKGISELTVKLIISVYEHHVNYDFSGYPEVFLSNVTSLFPRIIRIVDSYDAMTSRRIYCQEPKHPVGALEEIWNLAGKNFDPDLVKVFLRLMGVYPVGTVVQLSSGIIGLVVGQMDTEGKLGPRPVVEALEDWEDRPGQGKLIDLSRGDDAVVGYYDFGPTGFDPTWYLMTMDERPWSS